MKLTNIEKANALNNQILEELQKKKPRLAKIRSWSLEVQSLLTY